MAAGTLLYEANRQSRSASEREEEGFVSFVGKRVER